MRGRIDKVVSVAVEVLSSSYRSIYVPGMIEKVVLTSVEAL